MNNETMLVIGVNTRDILRREQQDNPGIDKRWQLL